ncbi:hypothetical protein AB3S75_023882 [Citrus x aurantiifolia]
MWEPTVVNLAHAYRKLKIYHEAISCYERALMLSNRSLSTYAGLAYTYHLQIFTVAFKKLLESMVANLFLLGRLCRITSLLPLHIITRHCGRSQMISFVPKC